MRRRGAYLTIPRTSAARSVRGSRVVDAGAAPTGVKEQSRAFLVLVPRGSNLEAISRVLRYGFEERCSTDEDEERPPSGRPPPRGLVLALPLGARGPRERQPQDEIGALAEDGLEDERTAVFLGDPPRRGEPEAAAALAPAEVDLPHAVLPRLG